MHFSLLLISYKWWQNILDNIWVSLYVWLVLFVLLSYPCSYHWGFCDRLAIFFHILTQYFLLWFCIFKCIFIASFWSELLVGFDWNGISLLYHYMGETNLCEKWKIKYGEIPPPSSCNRGKQEYFFRVGFLSIEVWLY